MLMEGCLAATNFVRFASAQTFKRLGRSMTTPDVIAGINEVVRMLDNTSGALDEDGA
jgi:hypothetical protein